MDFSTITNVTMFTKMQAFKSKGTPVKNIFDNDNSSKINEQQSSSIVGIPLRGQDDKLSGIITRMQSGQDLSPGELDYLRNNAPDVYDKAIAMAKERESYQEELRLCKTKEDVRLLHLAKIAPIFAKAKDAAARGDLATVQAAGAEASVLAAIFEKFTATKEYAAKSENHMELQKALKYEREKATKVEEPSEKTDIPDNLHVTQEDDVPVQPDDNTKPIKPAHSDKPQTVDTHDKAAQVSHPSSDYKATDTDATAKQVPEYYKTPTPATSSFFAAV